MFTYLKMKNFRSMIDVEVDFKNKRKAPKKLVTIYGENGSGKTNITEAFCFLKGTIATMTSIVNFEELIENLLSSKAIEPKEQSEMSIINLFRNEQEKRSMQGLIEGVKTIGNQENMILEFGLNIDGDEGYYLIETNQEEVVREKFYFKVNKKKGVVYEITPNNKKINDRVILNNKYEKEINELLEQYWGKHTLLAILEKEFMEKNVSYLDEKLVNSIKKIYSEIRRFSCVVKTRSQSKGDLGILDFIFTDLERGMVSKDDKDKLLDAVSLMNYCFQRLYSDIKEVYYVFEEDGDTLKYELFFKKEFFDEVKSIPFSKESRGTRKILELMPHIFAAIEGATVILDEFDEGIHDILVSHIIDALKDKIKGQLILTTHNTMLMNYVDKESVYMIVIDEDRQKQVVCITDYENRTQRTHNVEKRYVEGYYQGVPMPMDLDFDEALYFVKTDLFK